MKIKNAAIISFAILTVVFMGATAVSAAGNKMGKNKDVDRPVLTDEQKAEMETKRTEMQAEQEAMQSAITSGDYSAWKSLVEARQAKQVNILDVVNESNFTKFAEMHKLMESKDFEGAKTIAEELGLNNIHGMGMGMGMRDHGMGHGCGERPEQPTTKMLKLQVNR